MKHVIVLCLSLGVIGRGVGQGAIKITTTSVPDAIVGVAYSVGLAASGGPQPYTWSLLLGALPAGLTLISAGSIQGTATAAGAATFTLLVRDSGGGTDSQILRLTVDPAVTITTTSLPDATVGSNYSQALATSGGTPPFHWTLASGTLPAGVNLTGGGTLSGTPSAAGSFSFTVMVTDSKSATDSQALNLTVFAPLAVTTASLAGGTVGTAYQQAVSASGGKGGNSWSVTAGAVPAGLTLGADGSITGTPTTVGTANFTVQVKDSSNATATKALSIAIAPAALTVTTATLPGGTVGAAYQQALAASGGSGGNAWSVTVGALPAGLTLAASGSITGTPTTVGTASFTVQVKDSSGATATKALSIAIAPATLTVMTATLPGGMVGTAYQQAVVASGGSGGNVWSVTAGALPAGLTLGADGSITGTPTAAGTASFTVQVKDSSGATATKALSIAIAPAPLTVTTATLPGGTVGTAYQQALVASGGSGGNAWSVTAGAVPAGLTLGADGSITGTPTAVGTASFTVQVKDSSGATATKALSIAIAPAALTVMTATLPGGMVGTAYQQAVMASGGSGGNVWSVTAGALPAGLTLGADGSITGTPTAAGTASFTVQVKDSSGATATKALSIAIAPAALTVTTETLPGGTVGAAYQQAVAASGGSGGNAWSVTAGALPAGLTLGADGSITGTPTAVGTASFTVQVKDSSNATATKALSIAIAPAALTVTTATLPGGTVGTAYQQTLAASGGSGGNAWSVTAGALPAGLTLGADGSITGTPTAVGTASFTVQVKDSSGAMATKALSIAIAPAALTVMTAALPGGTVGIAYQQSLGASGGSGGNVWSLTAGALPAGLSLGSDGSITGTPAAAGTASFTVQVKDSSGAIATKALSIVVTPATLTVTTATLPGGTVGAAYQQALAASGGSGGIAWSMVGGALPAGLSLGADGNITGTPTAAGTANFAVQAKDSSGATATKSLSIAIAAAPLAIETSSLPPAAVGVAYLQPLTASGGSGNYAWSVSSGALPPGLVLSRSGTLGGTPAVAGPATFTVTVTDSGVTVSRSFSMQVEQPITITTSSLPQGVVGRSYSTTLAASGGSPPLTWAVISGQLPTGLTLDAPSGAIQGTPSVAGAFSIQVQVTDSASMKAAAQLTITIRKALSIATGATLATGSAGSAYSQTLAASGGTAPYTWTSPGTLPAGLGLSAAGVLSGTPTQVGTFSLTIQVADADSTKVSGSFSLQVVSGLGIATPPVLPPATKDLPYSTTLLPAGGSAPYQWTVTTGALPGGLTFSAAGQISGTASSTGSFQFTAQVTDGNSNHAEKQFTLVVAGTLSITSTALPAGATQSPYSQTLSANGGTAPYAWSVTTGALPDGLTLETPTGALAGTPTTAGTFAFTVTVTDANGVTAQRQFTISIGEGLRFVTPAALPGATVGVAYSFTMQAAGGQSPYSWSITQGALPGGLTLNGASGAIGGSPASTGTFNFTVQITDAAKATTTRVHTIVVGIPALPNVSVSGLPADVQPLEQPALDIALDTPYPVAITGTLSLTFTPGGANPVDDPAVQFSTGGRSATFTIPANATHAAFGSGQLAVQTGSVTGTITFRVVSLEAGGSSLTVPDGLTRTATVDPGPPVIRSLVVVHTANGIQVQIAGLSNTREMTKAAITFQAAPGTNVQTQQITVPLNDAATAWFQSDASAAYGGQFGLTLPFTFTGSVSLSSVSVVLSNGAGDSAAASGNY
jgi:hypothetical protein